MDFPFRQDVIKVSDWIEVRDNPIQRDTIRHAKKAMTRHLSKPVATHQMVSAAELPDGTLIKLDAHTRAYLWAEGVLTPLSQDLLATIYSVPDIEAAIDLYKTFDNSDASETQADKLSGAFRGLGIQPSSPVLTKGGFISALRQIHIGGKGGTKNDEVMQTIKHDVRKVVECHLDDLDAIDELKPKSTKDLNQGIIAAILLTYYLDRDNDYFFAKDFWQHYFEDAGLNMRGQRDGVAWLRHRLDSLRSHYKVISGNNIGREIAGSAMSCFFLHCRNETTSRRPNMLNLNEVISRRCPTIRYNKNGVSKRHVVFEYVRPTEDARPMPAMTTDAEVQTEMANAMSDAISEHQTMLRKKAEAEKEKLKELHS